MFSNFTWPADLPPLRRRNLIYGFNGCGKTTLSRILASLQDGQIDGSLPATTRFSIELDDGSSITEMARLDTLKDRILVFNEDFVTRCLHWTEGTANPVYYIGKDQAGQAKKLEEAETAFRRLDDDRQRKEDAFAQAQRILLAFKRVHARLIAEALGLGRRYTAPNLATDYAAGAYTEDDLKSEDERRELRAIIAQDAPLPKLPLPSALRTDLSSIAELAKAMLQKTVGQVVLLDLKDHPAILNWVQQGLEYHQEQGLAKCLFCGNDLAAARLADLNALIDDKFTALTKEIATTLDAVSDYSRDVAVVTADLPAPASISRPFADDYQSAVDDLKTVTDAGRAYLTAFETELSQKAEAPNTPIAVDTLPGHDACARWDDDLARAVSQLARLIQRHNETHDAFSQEQENARTALKKHFLAESTAEYAQNEDALNKAQTERDRLLTEIRKAAAEIEELKRRVRQHGPAAKRINKLLAAYLRHADLAVAIRDGDEVGYAIKRRGVVVKGTLSQGERTAIALCYFLSVLKAENRKLKDLIIVVDDPVSSLDTMALNYTFNLIKSFLSDAAQLIILTHNLPFMNEVKKWLRQRPKETPAVPPDVPKLPTAALWLLDSSFDATSKSLQSRLSNLPKLLRDYDSEYHYVFSIAYNFSNSQGEYDNFFYVMPNVLRKILEIFLSFKYPGPDGLASKVDAVARDNPGIDSARLRALNRLVQVESHADSLDDLISFSSMTIEETRNAADALLVVMEALDKKHLDRMKSKCNP